MKKLLFLFLASLFIVAGCSSTSNNENASSKAGSDKQYTIKLGHTGNNDHHYQKISERFAELVKERTDGNVTIHLFPSDQLGNQNESVEGVMIGTHDMVLTSDGLLANWVPDMGILNLPFLFKDTEQVQEVLSSSVGDRLNEQVEEHGAIILGWWTNGFRHITNSNKEILTPGDLKGLKIRVPETEVFIDTFQELGASPTPIAFGELYTALQLGTVDAQENPPAHIITQKFYEVQSHVSKTGHVYQSEPLLINQSLFESLPSEYQKVLKETAKELEAEHAKMVEELEAEEWKEIEAQGMTISEVDKEPFIKAVQPVYEKYKKKLNSELIDEILSITNN